MVFTPRVDPSVLVDNSSGASRRELRYMPPEQIVASAIRLLDHWETQGAPENGDVFFTQKGLLTFNADTGVVSVGSFHPTFTERGKGLFVSLMESNRHRCVFDAVYADFIAFYASLVGYGSYLWTVGDMVDKDGRVVPLSQRRMLDPIALLGLFSRFLDGSCLDDDPPDMFTFLKEGLLAVPVVEAGQGRWIRDIMSWAWEMAMLGDSEELREQYQEAVIAIYLRCSLHGRVYCPCPRI